MKYEITKATVRDAVEIDSLLSREDVAEAITLGQEPSGLVKRAHAATLESGGEAWTLRVAGKACAMFGVAASPLMGCPWLLGVDHIWAPSNWKRLLLNKQAKSIVSTWLASFGFLLNFISATNYTNIRYLKRMGFSVNESYNPAILVFHLGIPHV